MRALSPKLVLLATTLFISGCVTTSNLCGNEQRDWSNLSFPKDRYCSVPSVLPFAKSYEKANKAVCKVHDNNRGINSTIARSEADSRFLCDYIKRSEYPWGVRHVTGYLSYLAVRMTAPADKPLNKAMKKPMATKRCNPRQLPDSETTPNNCTAVNTNSNLEGTNGDDTKSTGEAAG